jgi:hypothetical protein
MSQLSGFRSAAIGKEGSDCIQFFTDGVVTRQNGKYRVWRLALGADR